MIITKKAMPRRTFLRGAGVTLALPLLDAMIPSFSSAAAATSVRRLHQRAHDNIGAPRRRPAG